MSSVGKTFLALETHCKRFPGQCLQQNTFAGDEFDRLYLNWIRARWDAEDPWVRRVWTVRP